jgi:hypothetical protein
MDFNVSHFHVVTVADIVALQGTRPQATQKDFRGGFMLVTATAATQDQMDRAARWARKLSGEEKSNGIFSFADATGGRATMTTRLHP